MQDAVFFAAAFATGRGAVDGALHRDGIARAPARISCMCMRAGMDARELECCGLLCGRLMSNAANMQIEPVKPMLIVPNAETVPKKTIKPIPQES